MVSDLDSDEQFSIEEVWNSTLYFKEIEYTDYESFANNSIDYVNNDNLIGRDQLKLHRPYFLNTA